MAEEVEEQPKVSMAEVAKKMYGDNFVGEVPEKEEAPKEETPAEEAEESAEEISEDASEEEPAAEEEAVEDSEDAEESEGTEEEKEVESEKVEIATLAELAEHFELDEDWAEGLKIPVKVNGAESTVPIKDLVASYQMGEAAEQQFEEKTTKARIILEEAGTHRAKVNDEAKIVASLLTRARELFNQDDSEIDWKKLRADDPAEYGAKKADMEERRKRMDDLEAEGLAEYQKLVQEQDEEMEGQRADMLRAEQAALLQKLPEWKDPKTAKTERAELSKYLAGQGFSDSDISKAADHKIIILARKAMLYDKGQGKANAAKKKVNKIPRIMKPGSPKPQDQRRSENITRLEARVKKSGKISDAVALLKAKRSA